MVRFLLKWSRRLSGFAGSGGDTTTGTRGDGEACEGAEAAFGGADAEGGDVVSTEACTEDCDGFVATVVKADAGLSERLPSSSETSGGVAGISCPLLIDVADCGEDWAWVAI